MASSRSRRGRPSTRPRAQRVLIEVVHRRDEPRDGCRLEAAVHRCLPDVSGACQQSTTDTARPPSDVSLYLVFISLAVSAIADTVVSKSTRRLVGISLLAIMKPVHAFTAPKAQRSMHGTCT